jgi:O-antigen ligase/tetratricopeptide (TPR) repeat protein
MDSVHHGSSRLERWGEGLSLALVALAPWAFGAVEAWAELALELSIAVLAAIALVAGWRAGRNPRPQLLGLPSVALLGLIGLALFQGAPLRADWLRRLAPAAAEARSSLAPATTTRVLGDGSGPVAPPAPTLSENRDETLRAAARLTAAWVLFQAVLALGGGPAALRRFGLVLAGNATLLALFSLIQALSWNGKIYWVRPSPMLSGWNSGGPFVGHSPLAAELNLGLGFALAFLLTPSRGRRFRPWAAYLASVIAVGVVASHSRTGFLAMAVALAVSALSLRSARYRPGAGIWIGLAAVLALIPLFLIATGQSSPFGRIGTITETSSYSPRLEIWKRSIDAWRQRPLLGSGLGTFATATSPLFTRDEGVVYTRAENEYLDLLVEGGAVGLGMMILFLVALVRSGRDALAGATAPRDRLVVLGALFGLLTLAIHSLSDFALHIPAVGITAVVLAARLTGLGQEARARTRIGQAVAQRSPRHTLAWAAAGLATLVPIAVVSAQGITLARAERALARTGLPFPGSALPEAQAANVPAPDLPQRRLALSEALALRPDWAEGHLRLGLTYLGLYRAQAQEWLRDAAGGPEQAAMLAGPLWLHGVVHSGDDAGRPGTRALVDQEPIRENLVPAARSFLEARRCCPTLALPHAELAQLDFLIERGEPVSVHAARALRLGRGSAEVLILAAQAAMQAGDADLACACWCAALAARPAVWIEVADQVGVVLPPERILTQILTPGSGQHLVYFAERLYAEPEDAEVRTRYMRAALKRLDHEVRLPEPERCQLVARAAAAVGDHRLARKRMEQALRFDPTRSEWRQQLILWLIEWGDPAEARRQALVGLHLEPADWRLRQALEAAAEALALGSDPTENAARNGRVGFSLPANGLERQAKAYPTRSLNP